MEVEEVFFFQTTHEDLKMLVRLGTLNVSEIAKRLSLNYSATNEHLQLLEGREY